MAKKVIITDYLHPYLAEQLTFLGFDVDVQEDITNEALFEIISKYDGLVVNTKIQVTPALIDKATQLKFIARAGSGMENIDSAYAKSKKITIISSPEGNANAVAEHAMAFLLSILNNIVKSNREIRSGIWQREQNRGWELEGKTVGIIGYGHTGQEFASKLLSFGVRILVYDKYKSGFGNTQIEESSLEQIQQNADIISFHVPLNAETHHYFNRDFIESMKKQFWVINTSRGKISDTESLIGGIRSGKILGAALDVFENEQFYQLEGKEKSQMEELCTLENIILTPHIAGWTRESYFKISKILAERIEGLNL